MNAIVVENVSKRFRSYHPDRPQTFKQAVLRGLRRMRAKEYFWALQNISFTVKPGSAIGLIGANGAGKSTLLRLIGGIGRPDSGRIAVNGRMGALLDLTTGFQPDLTGRENVYVTGVVSGLTRKEVAARFDQIVAFAELEEFIDNPIHTYSTGMQMRLGFAVAVHTDPEILLIDEVLAVGDIAFQQKCMARIQQFKKAGCTILLISHDPAQTKELCDQVLWLRNGQVAAQGSPEAVVGEYVGQLAGETRRRTPWKPAGMRTSSGTELALNKNRFGSQEMEITAVHLIDRQGQPVDALRSGEGLSVRLSYLAANPIAGPVFSVSISREDGFIYFDSNTAQHGIRPQCVRGAGQITLHVDRLDLPAGRYFVDAGIYERDWAYGYDCHWHVYPLEICAEIQGQGVLYPPLTWELSRVTETPAGIPTLNTL